MQRDQLLYQRRQVALFRPLLPLTDNDLAVQLGEQCQLPRQRCRVGADVAVIAQQIREAGFRRGIDLDAVAGAQPVDQRLR